MSIIKEADDKYVLNGKHSQVDLMKLLDQFIAKYVLCRKCENPETTIEIRRDTISLTCKACGEVTQFPVLDKFDTYISKLAASAKPAKVKKAPAAAPASDETASDTSAAAAGDEKKKKVLKKKVVPGKKVTKTPSAFTANLPVYSIESEIDVALASLDRGSSVEMLAGELRKIYDSLGDHRNCEHMARAIFSTVVNGDIAARIMAAGSVLAPYTAARQNVQFAVMGLLNTALAAKDLVPATVPGILKKFYDDDVLAEENVLAWVDANPDTPLTKAAEPFVNWLKTAETED